MPERRRRTDPVTGWEPADPFDLPDWLGEHPLTWVADEQLAATHVHGSLTGSGEQPMQVDLLCVDTAFPVSVVDERLRHDAHQAWHYDQVLLVAAEGRLALAVPTVQVDADLSCEALRRFAKAIGVASGQISVTLRL